MTSWCSICLHYCNVEVLIRLILYFQALVFDFQPKDPENLYVALDVISGRAVPGEPYIILASSLRRVLITEFTYEY